MVAQVDFAEEWEAAWARVAAFVPKFLAFLAILIIGYIVAKVIERVLDRVLERLGFDRLVERGGIKRALERSPLDASSILARLVFYAVFLFVLQLAFGVFGPNAVSDVIEGLIAFLPRIFVAVLILVITAFFANAVREIIQATIGGLNYGRIVATAASVGVWVLGLAAALNQVQVAPAVVNGILYALLALVVGVGIVAIGGGGVLPMKERWERALRRMEEEAPRVREEARSGSEPTQDVGGETRSARSTSARGSGNRGRRSRRPGQAT